MGILKSIIPVDDLIKTVKRFPYSTVCSVILCALIILSTHGVIDVDKTFLGRFMVILVYGFLWFGLTRLIIEGMEWSMARERMLGYGGLVIFSGFVFLGSGFSLVWLLVLVIPALLLGISVGPYVKSDDNLSLWFYNRQVWQGVSISIIAGLIWGGGIAAAMASIHYLFGISFGHALYVDVMTFSMIIFAPLYALSWVPEKYSYTEGDCHAPPQLAFVLNWVLAPLVIIYMLILYAYFVKIALAWELPRGQLSYMVSAFGGIGVLTYLGGWPLRDAGGIFLRMLYKLFFPALFVPVIMQALSILMRIEQYGLTEQRYLIALITFWLAVLAVIYTIKKPPLKYISGILAVLLMLVAVGPLSAPNVALRSQMNRLERLLVQNDILINGHIVKTEKQISFEDQKSIGSILDFLKKRKNQTLIDPWLGEEKSAHYTSFSKSITKRMGFEYVNSYQRKGKKKSENFHLNSDNKKSPVNVDGFKFLIPSQRVYLNRKKRSNETEKKQWQFKNADETGVIAYYKDDKLHIGIDYREELSFSVEEYALVQFQKDPSRNHRDLIIGGVQGDLRVKIIFENLTLRREKDEEQVWGDYKLNSFRFRALIGYD